MSKELKIIAIIITLILILLVAIITIVVVDNINKEKCYNMPLNDFYRDKSCLKYKERLVR